MQHPIERLEENLYPLIQKVTQHPLFKFINSVPKLRAFSQYHVFAVWDFMSLVKALQIKLTCITVPWIPSKHTEAVHLINKIVMEEESDITPDGRYLSHFDYYLEAMEECGADTLPIRQFTQKIENHTSVTEALKASHIPSASRHFVNTTFDILEQDTHQIMSAFLFGREDLMAKIFCTILENLDESSQKVTQKFCYYFRRHIELDEGAHAPEGRRLLVGLCGDDDKKWAEAEESAKLALQARYLLLEEIYTALQQQN